jgi:hypothetical protein
MRIWVRLAGGVLLLALGVLWILQGAGVLGRGGMSGKGQWFVIGLLVAVAGAVVLVGGARRLRAGRRG